MKRTIEVTVSPTGDIRIDAVGFQGADCQKATRFLEAALGATVTRQKKPEFYRRLTTQNQQKAGA